MIFLEKDVLYFLSTFTAVCTCESVDINLSSVEVMDGHRTRHKHYQDQWWPITVSRKRGVKKRFIAVWCKNIAKADDHNDLRNEKAQILSLYSDI